MHSVFRCLKEAFPLKYWFGYLTAAIFGAITWVLMRFGERFSTLVDMVYPYVIRTSESILAQWAGGVDFPVWQLLAVALGGMTALKTGATYLSLYYIIPLRSGIVRDIRNEVYDKITRLPIGFFTGERKGDVMARMSGDVAEIENSVMASLDMMFKNPVMIVVCLAMMVAVSWQLTVFVFVYAASKNI